MGLHPPGIFFYDQGTLDFRQEGSGAGLRKEAAHSSAEVQTCRPQAFVRELFKLAGRPFKASKHQEPCQRQVHLGLLNDFMDFQNGNNLSNPERVR